MFGNPPRGEAESVNIENNLAADNLYTLAFADGGGANQYNLENWFSRHESGYEDACGVLRGIGGGRQETPPAIWRILQLKLLGILRNPLNHNNLFVHGLHSALRRQLPETGAEFAALIAQRPPAGLEAIRAEFAFSPAGYIRWLSGLYGMLSDGVMRPSLFERLAGALPAPGGEVKIELFRYGEAGGCLFADTGFCLQASSRMFSVGVGIAADMFAVVHIGRQHWQNVEQHFARSIPPQPEAAFAVSDRNLAQRAVYNRLCVRQARRAVFGMGSSKEDYFRE